MLAGTAADNAGFYVLSGISPGRYVLSGSSIGYRTFVDTLSLRTGQLLSLNIALEPAPAELNEIVVEAQERFRLAFDNLPVEWNQAMPSLFISQIQFE